MTQIDIFRANESIVIGSRLKRLSDTFVEQVNELYKQLEVDLNPRFFPAILALRVSEPCSVGELSRRLGVSHPAAIQTLKLMKEQGLVVIESSDQDSRRSDVSLTDFAKRLIKQLEPVWEQLALALDRLLAAQAPNLLSEVTKLEDALAEKNLAQRYAVSPGSGEEVTVAEWHSRYSQAFYDLNEEWISRYFKMEEEDRQILGNAEREIVSRGGMVFFVKIGGLVAGTCAVIKKSATHYEVAKMAVSPQLQGRGLGRKLLERCVEWAKERGAKLISLESASQLESALKLYRSFGFRDAKRSGEASHYKRADVYMELKV